MFSNTDVINYFEIPRTPLPLNFIAKSVSNTDTIIAAINPRTTEEVIRGILRAVKRFRSVVIFELALSEMSITGGYTGYTPQKFAERCHFAAEKEKWFAYALHADHLTVKKGTEEEIENVKKEMEARVKAGFTGFAIDTSFLFNRAENRVEGQLREIISKGIELFTCLKNKMGDKPYGLEGEVGEIGITEYTTIEEALYYVKTLADKGVFLNYLAIANGSKHGVSVDAEGKIVPQLGINIKRTVEIVNALKEAGHDTKIAQHGITGTPIDVIVSTFPHGKIAKGNVGTHWQRLVYSVIEKYKPELYMNMSEWVLKKYGKPDVDEHKTFANNSKYAWKEFFDEVEDLSDEAKEAIIKKSEDDMNKFIEAFKMKNTAISCFNYLKNNNLSDTY